MLYLCLSLFSLFLPLSPPLTFPREGGREGKGREGKGREGKGREGKGREGKGREGKGREGKGRGGEGRGEEGREGGRGARTGRIRGSPKRLVSCWLCFEANQRGMFNNTHKYHSSSGFGLVAQTWTLPRPPDPSCKQLYTGRA